MAWTDERVARLSKLWAEGLSASQIAADLGDVSRNAVIGKVHRLGLSGRVKPGGNVGGRPKRTATVTSAAASPTMSSASAGVTQLHPGGARATGATMGGAASGGGVSGHVVGATALKIEADNEMVLEARVQEAEDVVVPMSKKLTLLELTEHTCKWPTGDPQRPGFSFCGHQTKEDTPYCEHHAKVAFQPPSERRRRR